MQDTTMTITGNLVDDPELRYTPAGQPVARFRIASTPRYQDGRTGEWKDGDTLFLTCVAWRQLAENTAESLTRGTRVIVTGRLRQRSYETKEGEKRTVYEVQADELGPSLRNASAKVQKTTRTNGGRGDAAQHDDSTDPWASEPGQPQRRTAVLAVNPRRAPVLAVMAGAGALTSGPGETPWRPARGPVLHPGRRLSVSPPEPVKGACGVASRPAPPP